MALQAPKLQRNAQETEFVKLKCKEYEKINKELEVNLQRSNPAWLTANRVYRLLW